MTSKSCKNKRRNPVFREKLKRDDTKRMRGGRGGGRKKAFNLFQFDENAYLTRERRRQKDKSCHTEINEGTSK